MSSETIYCGPAKVYRDSIAYFPEGENGTVDFSVTQERLAVASALHGQLRYQQGDCVGRITFTPFDQWSILAKLYPAALGATVEATTGVLAIGTNLAGGTATKVPTTIWVPGDQRSYVAVNTAIVKPPDLHLGNGKSLFGPMEIACIGDPAIDLGSAGFLFTHTASGVADPGGQMTMTDFAREKWTGAWSTLTNMQAEEEWVVACDMKVQDYKIQKLTRCLKLISVSFMARARVVGPTHANLNTALGIHATRLLGSSFGSDDLVLTSDTGRTITLKNASPVGTGFEFGGSRLGTGETAFVNATTFTAGVADPLIIFADAP